jgi:hypothetical protein
MKHLILAAGIVGALIGVLLAASIFVTGRGYVPGRIWARGYVGGVGAYAMAIAWVCLGAAALFASCMRAYPRQYFQHQRRRDISLVSFGVLFVIAVMGVIVERSSVGAL